MIEVRQLTKRYRDKVAVDQLNFAVRPGRVTGFLGPNGAGKSTTLRLILGLEAPTGGEVLVGGRRYDSFSVPLRHVGALLDANAVHPGRRAADHLLLIAQSNCIPRSRVNEVLTMVGLSDAARQRVGTFSLGMKQRLGIAAALLGDPAVLMFDEPVNGLDPEGIHWVRGLFKSLANKGRTVFVSSHLMSEMALTADHLVVIGNGRLIRDTPLVSFVRQSARADVLVRSADDGTLAGTLAKAGAVVIPEPAGGLAVTGLDADTIGEVAAAHHIPVRELSTRQASLEEAYMELADSLTQFRGTGGDQS